MEPGILIAGAGLLLAAVLLSAGVERITRRVNAHPIDSGEQSRGFRDVAAFLERRRRDRESRLVGRWGSLAEKPDDGTVRSVSIVQRNRRGTDVHS